MRYDPQWNQRLASAHAGNPELAGVKQSLKELISYYENKVESSKEVYNNKNFEDRARSYHFGKMLMLRLAANETRKILEEL